MKISIITINYNNNLGLRKTIESVICQDYADLEYIVIDGGSTDGSEEIIKRHNSDIGYWVSERDTGIYAAMNKGIRVAKGEYLLFLNSGDTLTSIQTISFFVQNIGGKLSDLIYGNLVTVDRLGKTEVVTYPNKLSFEYFIYQSLPHPSTFIKKSLFERYGLYDENLKICSDWKFFTIAVCKYNCSYSYINQIITKYDLAGISSDAKNMEIIRAEQSIVFNQEFSPFIKSYLELEQLKGFYSEIENSKKIKWLTRLGIIKLNDLKINPHFKIN